MGHLLSKIKHSNQTPLIVNILSTLLIAWIGYQSYKSLEEVIGQSRQTKAIMDCVAVIRHLDEVLTGSARLAANTGDRAAVKRYHQYEPILDSTIKRVYTLDTIHTAAHGFTEMDDANVKLEDLEHRALDLVLADKLPEACSLLYSVEYEREKLRYSNGLEQFIEALNANILAREGDLTKKITAYAFTFIITFVFLLAVWFYLSRFLSSSRLEQVNKNRLLEAEMKSRIRSEHALRESEQRIKSLYEDVTIGLYRITPGGEILLANTKLVSMLGYSCFDDFIREVQVEKVYGSRELRERFTKLIEAEGRVDKLESTWTRKDGSQIYVEESALAVRGEDGRIAYYDGVVEDITARKQAEDKLKNSMSLVTATLDSTDNGILAVALDGKVITANARFAEMWQIPSELVQMKNDQRMLAFVIDQLADPDEFLKRVEELYHDLTAESFELIYFKDGRIFERVSKPMFIAGKPMGRVWSFLDVTARKRAEEKVRMFQHTIRSINDIVNIADLNDNILFVNPAFCTAYGYTEEELIGKPSSLFWSPRNAKEVIDQILPATLAGGWQGELYSRRKDGSEMLIQLSTSVIRDDSGEPIALIGVVRDITELREQEKQRESLYKISDAVYKSAGLEELYQRIHKIVSELMPADNFYIAIYDAGTEMISFPYFVDEIDEAGPPVKAGKGCTEYVLRTGEAIIIGNALFDELRGRGEIVLNGEPSEVWLGVPLKIDGKCIGVMAVQDYKNEQSFGEKEKQILVFVSEQIAAAIFKKRAEETMLQYTKELEELNAAKNKFFSIIAHDLRSPFNYLLNFTEMMADKNQELSAEEISRYSKWIYDSATKLFKLVVDLLDWAQVQTGSISFDPRELRLTELINTGIETLAPSAAAKEIVMMDETKVDASLYADSRMVNTVLRNLLSNAVKFTQRGGKIILNARVAEHNAEISVSDSGVGMTDDDVKKLFRMGVKLSTRGTEGEPSTGLGLLLCKDFVERNGGKIWVESKPEFGSTFTFSVPLMKSSMN